jgi:hypothetical protein
MQIYFEKKIFKRRCPATILINQDVQIVNKKSSRIERIGTLDIKKPDY